MALLTGSNPSSDVRAADVVAGDVASDRLLRAAAFFAAAVVIHNSDHLRRGVDSVARDVFWLGTAGVVLEVAVVVLVCQRHRLAPVIASLAGFSLTAGYVAVHFVPAHPWFSDSFTSASHVSPLSWFAASLEVIAAMTLAVVGLIAMRHHASVASPANRPAEQRRLRHGLLHPLALGFALSQLVVLAVSFAQL